MNTGSEKNNHEVHDLDRKFSYFIGEFKEYQKEHNRIHNEMSEEIRNMMKVITPIKSIPVVLGTFIALGTIVSMVFGGIWWLFDHLK